MRPFPPPRLHHLRPLQPDGMCCCVLGLYRDHGKENENCRGYRDYIGVILGLYCRLQHDVLLPVISGSLNS